MKRPGTPEDIETEILIAADQGGEQRIRQLVRLLIDIDPETIVEGVIRVFERNDRLFSLFRDQDLAGRVLELSGPKSQKDLLKILKRTVNNWNKSVKQLPIWLHKNFGENALSDAFEEYLTTEDDPEEKIQTMRFWVGQK